MAIALVLGNRNPPSPEKPHPLRVPAAVPETKLPAKRPPRIVSTHTILLFSAIAVVCIATRNISICYSGWAWHYTHRCEYGVDHPWADVRPPAPNSTDARKIAVAMIIDDFLDPQLRNATIENKLRYARRWGYDAVIPDIESVRDAVPGLPVAWGKFPIIKKLLDDYDFVLMIDADAVFLRDDISLHAATKLMEKENTSLLISNDLNGPNSGVFMMRRGDWSTKFLDHAMDSSALLSAKTALLPLRFENRAFLYLLGAWPTCIRVRRFDSLLAPVSAHARQLRRGVTTVDRCLINRRPRRATEMRHFFLNTGAGFDDTSDAFIGHAAGGGVSEKSKTMREMLEMANRRRTRTAVAA